MPRESTVTPPAPTPRPPAPDVPGQLSLFAAVESAMIRLHVDVENAQRGRAFGQWAVRMADEVEANANAELTAVIADPTYWVTPFFDRLFRQALDEYDWSRLQREGATDEQIHAALVVAWPATIGFGDPGPGFFRRGHPRHAKGKQTPPPVEELLFGVSYDHRVDPRYTLMTYEGGRVIHEARRVLAICQPKGSVGAGVANVKRAKAAATPKPTAKKPAVKKPAPAATPAPVVTPAAAPPAAAKAPDAAPPAMHTPEELGVDEFALGDCFNNLRLKAEGIVQQVVLLKQPINGVDRFANLGRRTAGAPYVLHPLVPAARWTAPVQTMRQRMAAQNAGRRDLHVCRLEGVTVTDAKEGAAYVMGPHALRVLVAGAAAEKAGGL